MYVKYNAICKRHISAKTSKRPLTICLPDRDCKQLVKTRWKSCGIGSCCGYCVCIHIQFCIKMWIYWHFGLAKVWFWRCNFDFFFSSSSFSAHCMCVFGWIFQSFFSTYLISSGFECRSNDWVPPYSTFRRNNIKMQLNRLNRNRLNHFVCGYHFCASLDFLYALVSFLLIMIFSLHICVHICARSRSLFGA